MGRDDDGHVAHHEAQADSLDTVFSSENCSASAPVFDPETSRLASRVRRRNKPGFPALSPGRAARVQPLPVAKPAMAGGNSQPPPRLRLGLARTGDRGVETDCRLLGVMEMPSRLLVGVDT